MQHIPVVSHALWKRDSCFENVGRGPCYTNNWLIPSTGLVFIYSGRRASQGRGVEWRGEGSGREAGASHRFQWGGGIFSKGSRVASPHQHGQLCSALLTSTWVSALEKVSGVGGSTVVPLYIQWVEPRCFLPPPWLMPRCHPSLCTPHHSPLTPPLA